jgi:hypothetical protein
MRTSSLLLSGPDSPLSGDPALWIAAIIILAALGFLAIRLYDWIQRR